MGREIASVQLHPHKAGQGTGSKAGKGRQAQGREGRWGHKEETQGIHLVGAFHAEKAGGKRERREGERRGREEEEGGEEEEM